MAYNAAMLPVRFNGDVLLFFMADIDIECGGCDDGTLAFDCEYSYGSLEDSVYNILNGSKSSLDGQFWPSGREQEGRGARIRTSHLRNVHLDAS